MDLLIHVGLHKTGTTSVQETLHANAQALRKHGILYPTTGLLGSQHALIPGCLIANHPFLGTAANSRTLEQHLASLQAELKQVRPSLTILSSEVFTEVIHQQPQCLQLIHALSRPFARTSLLLSRREPTGTALSSLKHMLREHFAASDAEFRRAVLDPLQVFRTTLSSMEKAIRFWRQAGWPLQERHLETAPGSLADHYLGDILDHYSRDARHLLRPAASDTSEPLLKLNADNQPPVTYMLLFLLANCRDADILLRPSSLAVIDEECARSARRSGLADRLHTKHLLRYFDHCLAGEPPRNSAHIPIQRKLDALAHAGLDPADIRGLFDAVQRVRVRIVSR